MPRAAMRAATAVFTQLGYHVNAGRAGRAQDCCFRYDGTAGMKTLNLQSEWPMVQTRTLSSPEPNQAPDPSAWHIEQLPPGHA